MVRFLTDDTAANDAALRAARGQHRIIFEDGDQAPALRARTPHLQWIDIDGAPSLPFGEFADFTLRFLPCDKADAAWRNLLFHLSQITAVPLNRMWQLVLPGLGLASVAAAATAISRRALRKLVEAQITALSDAQRESLVPNQVDDWMDRLAPASHTAAPWTTHGGWIRGLTWGMLAGDDTFGAAADLLLACQDAHSDEAYANGDPQTSITRAALAALAICVRAQCGDPLEGVDLAQEVADAVRESSPPTKLIVHASPERRLGTLKTLIKWRYAEGADKKATEARLLSRAMPGAADSLPGVAGLIKGAGLSDIEPMLKEYAAEASIADREALSISLLHRVERELKKDRPTAALPEVTALPPAGAPAPAPAPALHSKPYQQALLEEHDGNEHGDGVPPAHTMFDLRADRPRTLGQAASRGLSGSSARVM